MVQPLAPAIPGHPSAPVARVRLRCGRRFQTAWRLLKTTVRGFRVLLHPIPLITGHRSLEGQSLLGVHRAFQIGVSRGIRLEVKENPNQRQTVCQSM